jgi:hypothetical protein
MDRCRTVMIEYGAPRNLWGYAVEYICHTINCTRVLARNNKTAYELVHGLKPDVSKFVPFMFLESLMYLLMNDATNTGPIKANQFASLATLDIVKTHTLSYM